MYIVCMCVCMCVSRQPLDVGAYALYCNQLLLLILLLELHF